MTPTELRDQTFREIHADLLKPLGFKKVGLRSERVNGLVHQAVSCFSSRFNSEESARFTLEFRVTHEEYFRLFQPDKAFPGLVETYAPMVCWRLRKPFSNVEQWWSIESEEQVEEVLCEIRASFGCLGSLWIENTKTIEGIASFCAERNAFEDVAPRSWALAFMGRRPEANRVVLEATKLACTEEQREFLSQWRDRLANPSFNGTPDGAR